MENPQVMISGRSIESSVDMHPLESRYFKLKLISSLFWSIIWIGLMIIFTLMFSYWYFDWVKILIALTTAFFVWYNAFLLKKGFKRKAYALRSYDILYQTGLIWRRFTAIPYNRIQHCEIHVGPLERLFDLASLQIYTAGGSGSDIVIPGLSFKRANQIKDFITEKVPSYEE